MGLGHLPSPTRFNDGYYAAVFDNTWGHLAPQKNVSYNGIVRFVVTDHSHYGCQPIIIQYEFPNLEGPYLHDELFDKVCDWKDDFEPGTVYERLITFRNYRFYYGKVTEIFKAIKIVTPCNT